MYGNRDAAANWEAEYTQGLIEEGFSPSIATLCSFYNEKQDPRCVVHGDDFTCLGNGANIGWYETESDKHFDLTFRGRLGVGCSGDNEI